MGKGTQYVIGLGKVCHFAGFPLYGDPASGKYGRHWFVLIPARFQNLRELAKATAVLGDGRGINVIQHRAKSRPFISNSGAVTDRLILAYLPFCQF